jgi:nitroreductase
VNLDHLTSLYKSRRSIRGFLPDAVEAHKLHSVFEAAQAAPSWCNIQPWRVALTNPPYTAQVADAMVAAAKNSLPKSEVPFIVDYPSPYKEHRRDCGIALYQAMGVAKDDKPGRYAAWLRNFAFFGAPHVAIVSCERSLGAYAYVDVGVWLGYLLAAAHAAGIATCPMASVATYPNVLRKCLEIPENETILFGIAMGYEDSAVPANQCQTTRAVASANVRIASPT